eukprot:4456366-Karenia_brevis.AAC.1
MPSISWQGPAQPFMALPDPTSVCVCVEERDQVHSPNKKALLDVFQSHQKVQKGEQRGQLGRLLLSSKRGTAKVLLGHTAHHRLGWAESNQTISKSVL